jgi:flagellar hook capping protein FlgD
MTTSGLRAQEATMTARGTSALLGIATLLVLTAPSARALSGGNSCLILVPIRWCATQGSPISSDELQMTFGMWQWGTDISEGIWGPQANVGFRPAVSLPFFPYILDLPVIPDPCPGPTGSCPGSLGDLQDDALQTYEQREAYMSCAETWRSSYGTSAGIVVVIARQFVGSSGAPTGTLGVDWMPIPCSEPILDGDVSFCTNPNNYDSPAFTVRSESKVEVEDPSFLGNSRLKTLAHELGHALSLGHGDGLDNDADGRFDECCDPGEISTGQSLMDYTSSTAITGLQTRQARIVAARIPGVTFVCPGSIEPYQGHVVSDIAVDHRGDAGADLALDIAMLSILHDDSTAVTHLQLTLVDSLDLHRSRRYAAFVDLDRNAATGGPLSSLGFASSFAGAELAADVVEDTTGATPGAVVTVWKFAGRSWLHVFNSGIHARVLNRSFGHVEIELPDSVVGARADTVRAQAIAQYASGTVVDRLPDNSSSGADFALTYPRFGTCEPARDAVAPGDTVSVHVAGLAPLRAFHLYLGSVLMGGGTLNASGGASMVAVVPESTMAGSHLLAALVDSSALEGVGVLTVVHSGGIGPSGQQELLAVRPIPARSFEGVVVELRLAQPVTDAEVAIYSIAGQRVALLASGPLASGVHSLRWDGHNTRGEPAGPGVYYACVRIAERWHTSSIVLLR